MHEMKSSLVIICRLATWGRIVSNSISYHASSIHLTSIRWKLISLFFCNFLRSKRLCVEQWGMQILMLTDAQRWPNLCLPRWYYRRTMQSDKFNCITHLRTITSITPRHTRNEQHEWTNELYMLIQVCVFHRTSKSSRRHYYQCQYT